MTPNPTAGAGERDEFCRHYADCLDLAVREDWPGFTCAECPIRGTARVAPEETVLRSQRQATALPVVQVEATPVAVAPPTAPPARREIVATAARRQQQPPAPPPAKEKPMPVIPTTSALERARELRAEQEKLALELQMELGECLKRADEIREVLEQLGAGEAPTPTPRKGPPRGGGKKGEVLAYVKKHGPVRTLDVANAVGMDVKAAGTALSLLLRRGEVRRVAHGTYEAA